MEPIAQTDLNWLINQSSFSYNAGGAYTGYPAQFSADPADPTQSKFGRNGEPFTVIDTAPLTLAGVTWTATFINLEYAEYNPNQTEIMNFAGLSGATLPKTFPITPTATSTAMDIPAFYFRTPAVRSRCGG